VAPPSVDENQDDAQQTPNTDTAKAHAASSSSSGKDARNTPDTVDRLDLTAHQDSTLTSSGGTFVISKAKNPEPSTEPKSFQPEEMGKSPKKKRPFEMLLKAEGLAATRCSVGVRASPRLKAQARRSLQASFGNVLLEDSEKEEDLQDLTGRISLLEPSWSTTINQSINDLTSNEDDVPVPRNLFLDEDDGLTVATATRRPSRAAKAKIQTMKEPSLNSKMRRPANVEPLTSSQDKRHTARKSKKPSSTLTHKVIVHSSD
jgi:Shugoshin C terminus